MPVFAGSALLVAPLLVPLGQAQGAPEPLPAAETILDAFADHDLVAIGERHDTKELHDFYVALIRHPRFASVVDDIVLEIANAKHQPLLDAFARGEDLPLDAVRCVWRDCTNSLLQDGDPQGLEELVVAVRERNAGLKPEERIRLLAGDPAFDWQEIEAPREFYRELSRRDEHYASVVEHEVLLRGRHALLLIGRGHTSRRSARSGGTVAHRLEKLVPGRLWSVNLLTSDDPRVREARANWTAPSVLRVESTWLGELTPSYLERTASDAYPRLAGAIDAVLYLGPPASLTDLQARPFDARFAAERARREALFE